ncbi:MAG: 50S ribosomal protein L13, partial [Defluviitaleaceae bacterium]|nr:50S ribosomal protein L13 [Defluviitaleaceae bacterium]
KVEFTGNKLDQKIYWRHSGYIGGLKTRTLREQLKRQPEEVLRHAIKGMLPKGALGRAIFKKLHVYAGGEHKHQAQKPEVLEINY